MLSPSSFQLGLLLLCNIFEAMKMFHYLKVGLPGKFQVHKIASAKVGYFGMF